LSPGKRRRGGKGGKRSAKAEKKFGNSGDGGKGDPLYRFGGGRWNDLARSGKGKGQLLGGFKSGEEGTLRRIELHTCDMKRRGEFHCE